MAESWKKQNYLLLFFDLSANFFLSIKDMLGVKDIAGSPSISFFLN